MSTDLGRAGPGRGPADALPASGSEGTTQPSARFSALRLAGPDAAAFLQGYLTADLEDLAPQRALPMAYCNLKGRVLASGWAAGSATDVLLVVDASVAAPLAADLRKYLLFAKAKLAAAPERLAFVDSGAGAAGSMALPPTGCGLLPLGAPGGGHDAVAAACAASGFVVVSAPVSQRFLPQMIGLTDAGAVSFAKGCYLGQEVVARAEHRGQVKQALRRFRPDGAVPPVGAQVLASERKVGVVVASVPGLVLASVRDAPATATAGGCELHAAPA